MSVPILEPDPTWWECPECGAQDRTVEARPHSRMHACPELGGVIAPFVQVADPTRGLEPGSARLVAVERDDYETGEAGLRRDQTGRPISAVRTERPDGSNDVHVFPATATARTSQE